MVSALPRVYFQNPAGRLLEQPAGRYLVVRYGTGPRRLADLQTLLGHAKQLLARHGWHKLLADHRRMSPFSPEERHWLNDCWLNMPRQRMEALYGAILLSRDAFAQLPASQAAAECQAAALTYRHFLEEEPAAVWLKQLP